jgi:quercetin dioxygenase-like cupin family protein
MKKIALSLTVLTALFLVARAADEKAKDSANTSAKESAAHVMLTPADLKWGPAPAALPPGAKMAVLEGDPTKAGLYTVRAQFPAGYKIPPHTHPTDEHLTIISGALHAGAGEKFDESSGHELPIGGFAVMPAGMKHYAWATTETVVQLHGMGPFQITYVNSADDPRNAKK